MTSIHGGLAALAAVAAVGTLLAAGILGWRGGSARHWLDRAILAALAVVAADAAIGLVLVASGHAPTDLLHVVYGAVAIVVLPLGRWAGRSTDLRRRALWLAGGSVVLLAVLARLAQTG
jgi:hypothetical protein